ncbi:hypothetical protein FAF44_50645 [Nonomuraea sp. MG754425]|uniref:hypothetical protein n=1 Tax=Nonomuraea sp. MG754425 TaxID=2570319 RepID=UPI001F1D4CF8|nr:hypothetical protein [Nonomuraea sp. MG754425]MCF6476538.1 hypothetical protein [Nonomuraea sp. MG754425]
MTRRGRRERAGRRSALHRLYSTKLVLYAVIGGLAGLALLVVVNVEPAVLETGWIRYVPLKDIGTALLSTALIAVLFEYLEGEDAESRVDERLTRLFPALADTVVSRVLDRFSAESRELPRAMAPEAIDRLATNALSARLGDRELAEEVYADLRAQVIATKERLRDFQVSITLSRFTAGPPSGTGSFLEAVTRCEYLTRDVPERLRFSCVSDIAEYRTLVRDPESTFEWYFEPVGGLHGGSAAAFELFHFTLNGREQQIRRTRRTTSQSFLVDNLAAPPHEQGMARVSYAYKVLVQRNSHMLNIDVAQPSRGFRVQLSYGACGIRFVNVLDFIAGAVEPRILHTPGPAPTVSIGFDGWVFPKSGVAFVWVLDEEL